MQLSSASFAYPSVDRIGRAALTSALTGADPGPDVFVLSTCLRTEVAVPGDETLLKETMDRLVGALPVEPAIRVGEDAASHLFRIAAGLESPIIGEVEVLTQFRQALANLKDAGTSDGSFLKLLEAAVAAGRELRAELGTSPHDTMAAIAAQIVGAVEEVAVVGSGTMATAVAAALAALPVPPRIRLLARSPHLVTAPVDDTDVRGIDDLAETLRTVPAVISATAASTRLVDGHDMAAVLADRRDALLLVDMAMPPDFEPDPEGPVRYLGIDDLAAMAWTRPRTTRLDQSVAMAAAEAHRRYAGGETVGAVIARMMRDADAVVDETVARFEGRLRSPSDAAILRQVAHTVARTILAGPVGSLNASRDPDVVEAIAWAFDVDD